METTVYYHNDLDGFGAAFATWLKLGDDGVEYVCQRHTGEVFKLREEDKARRLVFLDFFPDIIIPPDVSSEVIIIDHHPLLENFHADNYTIVHSAHESAAPLAYKYWFKDEAMVPSWALYISDYDTWTKSMTMTEEVNMALWLLPKDFITWKELLCDNEDAVEMLCNEGKTLVAQRNVQVKSLVKLARSCRIGNMELMAVNTSMYPNEVAVALMEPGAFLVAATYYDTWVGDRKWCLRSATGGPDVGQIARDLGGGGHYHASGFTETWPIVFV